MSVTSIPLTTPATIPAAQASNFATSGPAAGSNTLSKDGFLKLLVTQLQYQDPTSPMDTSAMMAQETQLASMEQLTALGSTQTESLGLQMRLAAADLVGKQVTYTDASGATLTGTVTATSYAASVPTVHVAGADIALDHVSAVTQTTAAPSTTTA